MVLETATGTTMFSSAKQNARGSQVLLWRGRQGRVGEEALAVHLTSHFFLFSLKGKEWQPEHALVLSLSNGYTSICPLLSDNLHQNNFIVEMRK